MPLPILQFECMLQVFGHTAWLQQPVAWQLGQRIQQRVHGTLAAQTQQTLRQASRLFARRVLHKSSHPDRSPPSHTMGVRCIIESQPEILGAASS